MRTTTFVLILLFTVSEAVYFAHRNPELCLHIPAESGTIVGKVYAYQSVDDGCQIKEDSTEVITYELKEASSEFEINSTGFIVLRRSLSNTTSGPAFVSVTVLASCKTQEGILNSTETAVTVNFHRIAEGSNLATNQLVPDKYEIDRICFSHISKLSTLAVEENVKDVVLGRLNTCWQDQKYERIYKIEKPKSRFVIDPVTSEVRLIKQLDRELLVDNKGQPNSSVGIQPLRITCEVKVGDVTYKSERHRMNVTVVDVNDNPPRFYLHNGTQHIVKDVEIQAETSVQDLNDIEEIIEDMDSVSGKENDAHLLKVIADTMDVCKTSLHCLNVKQAKTVCLLRIHLQNINLITATLYKCEVAVIDNEFIQPADKSINNSATIVINVHKPSPGIPTALSLKSTPVIHFNRNATRLARLYQLKHDQLTISPSYTLRDQVFQITPDTGIIYVNDTDALAVAPNVYSIVVEQTGGSDVTIDILLHGKGRPLQTCSEGCSMHDSASSCNGSCGLGLTSGVCVMRSSDRNTQMSTNYGTCTHETKTCPDLACDELEEIFPNLCPQDCTYHVSGAYMMNTAFNPARGIVMAESPCWCEEDYGIYCYCIPIHISDHRENYSSTNKNVESASRMIPGTEKQTTAKLLSEEDARNVFEKTSAVIQQPVTDSENHSVHTDSIVFAKDRPTKCDKLCGIAIGVGLTMFILVSFSLFMLWFTKKKNDRSKSNMKHVGSIVSISGLPSDYQEERERRLSYSSDHWSQKGPIYSSQIQYMHDDTERWEISRESLTLEKTLGEGEFGLVVKAKLAATDGDRTVRNVAVKMLKHCSTQLEEQDIWSEFNLLKDVSHPNVIRLIGACTTDGPFYLVVEYCRHGCLLKYLRRSRLEENGYVNSGTRFKSPNANEQTDQELTGDLLSMRDLLSFAWQIAKGMSYLSEIKLVHRDLAARNILVASGKVLKISDFGLTRDVYEADTYLKKSKGRIPVKWLAPESLYAQIYTTRSDTWSYGIVLWELVTLGAPPYPGIPPERLYNLLIGGYRMDKPENCPDEMYAVMQKCWKIDAMDRPSFATLASIFDRILQEKTGYLDLTQANTQVADLYNKCFSSSNRSGSDAQAGDGKNVTSENVSVIKNDSNRRKSTDNVDIFTVCNETYTSDNYLVPVSSSSHQSNNSNQSLPLLETGNAMTTGAVNAKTNMCSEHVKTEPDVHDAKNNETLKLEEVKIRVPNEERVTKVEQNENISVENHGSLNGSLPSNNRMISTRRGQEPMFRKKSENPLPTIRYTKNSKTKHVIFPSENVALLTETGTASCLRDGDSIDQQTSKC